MKVNKGETIVTVLCVNRAVRASTGGLLPLGLPADIVLGQLSWLRGELLRLVALVAVSQILSKLLRSQTELLGQAV